MTPAYSRFLAKVVQTDYVRCRRNLRARFKQALERLKDRRSSIDLTYILPNPTMSDRLMTAERARTWLLKAEKRAGLEQQDGSLAHTYRGGWMTSRNHLPDAGVALAGGWKGTETLRTCYQQTDPASLLAVVVGGRVRRDVAQ